MSYKTDFLPFSREDFKFRGKIGEGGMNDVFLLESKKADIPSWVIKIPHVVKKNDIFQQTLNDKEEYLKISELFKEIPGLVLDEQHMLLHGPRGNKTVPAICKNFYVQSFGMYLMKYQEVN